MLSVSAPERTHGVENRPTRYPVGVTGCHLASGDHQQAKAGDSGWIRDPEAMTTTRQKMKQFKALTGAVPLPAAELWYGERGLEGLDAVAKGGIVRLSDLPPQERKGLGEYWEKCQQFWADLDAGREPGPWLAVQRQIVDARQRRGEDLVDELEALLRVGAFGSVVEYFCDNDPDPEKVLRLATDVGGELNDTKLGRELTLVVDGELVWDEVLGGPAGPGEWSRTFRLEVSHAKWRDRRARRLISVQVYADEVWPAVPAA